MEEAGREWMCEWMLRWVEEPSGRGRGRMCVMGADGVSVCACVHLCMLELMHVRVARRACIRAGGRVRFRVLLLFINHGKGCGGNLSVGVARRRCEWMCGYACGHG